MPLTPWHPEHSTAQSIQDPSDEFLYDLFLLLMLDTYDTALLPGHSPDHSRNSLSTAGSHETNNRKRTHDGVYMTVQPDPGSWSSDEEQPPPQEQWRLVLAHLLENGLKDLDTSSWTNRLDCKNPVSWRLEDHSHLISRAMAEGLDGLDSLGKLRKEWCTEKQDHRPISCDTPDTTPVASFLAMATLKNSYYCIRTHRNLLELRHAGGCGGTRQGAPCTFSNCETKRKLWNHLLSCSRSSCTYPDCLYACWAVSYTEEHAQRARSDALDGLDLGCPYTILQVDVSPGPAATAWKCLIIST